MADEGTKGQLLFDLIAPLPSRPSAFEEAAWAAAAASVRSRSAPPDPAALPPAVGGEAMRSGPAAPDAEERRSGSALYVVGQAEEEPPLAPGASGRGSDAAGPGPRVAAFAAATGAATRSAVVTKQSRPATGAGLAAKPEREAPDAPTPRAENHLVPTSSPLPPAPAPAHDADPREPAAVAGDAAGELTQGTIPAATGEGAVPPAGLPPLENDEDFGPLILVEKPRRRPRSGLWKGRELGVAEDGVPEHPGGSRRRARTGLLLVVALMAAATVSAWWVVAGRGQPAADTPAAAAPAPDVSMVYWRGMELPVSKIAGPTTFTDTSVGGFTRSALGAAIAAAHLVVRTDPVAGADAFEPVLATQVVGAKDRLADAVHAQAAQTVEAGTPGTLLGWRLDGDPATGAVVAHLAVEQAGGSRVDFAVPLRWVDGDWRIDAPAEGDFFPITTLSGDYTPFTGEATIS